MYNYRELMETARKQEEERKKQELFNSVRNDIETGKSEADIFTFLIKKKYKPEQAESMISRARQQVQHINQFSELVDTSVFVGAPRDKVLSFLTEQKVASETVELIIREC